MSLMIELFESETCSRCRGSGTYSYTQKWGTTCFKCGSVPGARGSGFQCTKLGVKAHEAWLAANADIVPATELVVGDSVLFNQVRVRVREITHGQFGSSSSLSGGVRTTTAYDLQLRTSDGVHRPMASTSLVERWTQRLSLPPAVSPGTERKAEMKAYILAAAAARGESG